MTQTEQDIVLRLTRRFDAPREEVFDAWTDPNVLREWWAAQPTWDTPVAEADARPGGTYRLSMRDTDTGQAHTLVGEYKEVDRPSRLVYTWTWETNEDAMRGSENTLVEIEFAEDGDGTQVTVTHSGFATAQLRDMHAHGWNGCLDNLASRVFDG